MGVELAIAGISAAVSVYSTYSANERADEANESANKRYKESVARQNKIDRYNKEAYDMHIAEYERMRNIYGPLQEDIGTYYRNLTGESLSNDRVAKIQKAYQTAQDDVRKKLAQSGRSTSGVHDELLASMAFDTTMNKATARMTAETDVINMKEDYVDSQVTLAQNEMGMATGDINGMQVGVNNINNLATQQSDRDLNAANAENKRNDQFYSDMGHLIGWGGAQYKEYLKNQARGTTSNGTNNSDYLGMF